MTYIYKHTDYIDQFGKKQPC